MTRSARDRTSASLCGLAPLGLARTRDARYFLAVGYRTPDAVDPDLDAALTRLVGREPRRIVVRDEDRGAGIQCELEWAFETRPEADRVFERLHASELPIAHLWLMRSDSVRATRHVARTRVEQAFQRLRWLESIARSSRLAPHSSASLRSASPVHGSLVASDG